MTNQNKDIKYLKLLLTTLQDFGVTSYENVGLKITINPKKHDQKVELKELKPLKTKLQEDEELLFHSAGR